MMSDGKIEVLVTGDTYLGGGRVKKLAVNNNYNRLFGEFKQQVIRSDLAVTNLESPLLDEGNPIAKTGPALKAPVKAMKALTKNGFDLVTLANNHIMDYGIDGLNSTIDTCDQFGISYTGVGHSRGEAATPFMRGIKGLDFAIINIAENEFSTTHNNSPGCNALDIIKNFYDIKRVKEKVDYLILIIHGGHEMYPLPSPRMKETYRFLADAGADIIIGHHPHCYSGYEIYDGSLICYSLGNFLFDQSNNRTKTSWNKGYMLKLCFDAGSYDFEKIPYVQNARDPGLRKLTDDELSEFKLNIGRLNEVIKDEKKLEDKFDQFCLEKAKQYNAYIEPHSNRYLYALQNRNLLPSFISKRKRKLLLNLVRCESHRDMMLKILQQ